MGNLGTTSRSALNWTLTVVVLFFGVAYVDQLNADDSKNRNPEDAQLEKPDDQASAERLALMRRRVTALTAEVETTNGRMNVEIIANPLLRYSNQAAKIITQDATVWAWGQVGRPVALASVETDGFEVVSLSEHPVSFSGKLGVKWRAKASEVKWKPVPDAGPPGPTATTRARQMKEICARFSASGYYGDGTDLQLRLMVRHLHRYSDPDNKLIDGAIFTFAGGTNPEVLLLLECRESTKTESAWYYGIARLSGGKLETKLDNQLVWECPAITAWSSQAPYTSMRFDPDDKAGQSEK